MSLVDAAESDEIKRRFQADLDQTRLLAERIVGLTAVEAKQLVEQAGRMWRVVPPQRRLTMDLAAKRVRVWVDDGVVVRARGG